MFYYSLLSGTQKAISLLRWAKKIVSKVSVEVRVSMGG